MTLGHFLEFAERGVRALVEARPDRQTDADTSLEHSIAAALASRGWQVETHIGVWKAMREFGVDQGIGVAKDYVKSAGLLVGSTGAIARAAITLTKLILQQTSNKR